MLLTPPGGITSNYNDLLQEVSHLVTDRTQQVKANMLQLVPGTIVPVSLVNNMGYVAQEVQ